MTRDAAALRVVGAALLAAFVANLAASASYRMWWGGASAPARFLVPMLLSLALPIGVAWIARAAMRHACSPWRRWS